MRASIWIVVVGLVLVWGSGSSRPQDSAGIHVRELKYDGLKQAVLGQRGKVVLVDFWSTTCPPCRKAFPHLVEVQHKYASRGLTTISVSLDELGDDSATQRRERVLGDLRKFQANIVNLILDEPFPLVTERLRISQIPCVYVFSRQGKWTQFGGGAPGARPFDPAAIDRLVVELLQE